MKKIPETAGFSQFLTPQKKNCDFLDYICVETVWKEFKMADLDPADSYSAKHSEGDEAVELV